MLIRLYFYCYWHGKCLIQPNLILNFYAHWKNLFKIQSDCCLLFLCSWTSHAIIIWKQKLWIKLNEKESNHKTWKWAYCFLLFLYFELPISTATHMSTDLRSDVRLSSTVLCNIRWKAKNFIHNLADSHQKGSKLSMPVINRRKRSF